MTPRGCGSEKPGTAITEIASAVHWPLFSPKATVEPLAYCYVLTACRSMVVTADFASANSLHQNVTRTPP
jgi:hypothetical protein